MELGEEKVQVKKDTAGEDNVIGERVVLSQFFSFLFQLWIQRLIFDFSQRLRDRFVSGF